MVKYTKVLILLFLGSFLVACGGTKSVPVVVQSDPLGAYVTYQIQRPAKGAGTDWVFLGKTPIDIKRRISKKQFKKAGAFRLRVMKEGYSDQIRDWTRKEINREIKDKGQLFWNPKLVPSQ